MRKNTAIGLVLMGALLLAPAAPAAAGSQNIGYSNCTAELGNNSSRAWTYGDCSSRRARHQYMTSGNLHWTYCEDSAITASSPVAPQLVKSEHRFTAGGSARTVTLGA